MTTTLRLTRSLCSPLRDDVYTALTDFGVRVLDITAWGEGHWHIECPDSQMFPDSDIWVKRHVCEVTVNDTQAAWAERLLWQTGKMSLESRPLVPSLVWSAPADCKAGVHGTVGRGIMFKAWKDNPRQSRPKRQSRRQRQTRRTRQARQDDGDVLGRLAKWLE